ncbi:hypothetical protein PENTCL1PPCAC_5118 [Pristionchus entomophagus]|uniref:UPAR/Ly6 domain-containing protein n=1 Tax=Pristionchus entomophagus TaxID=358040 RepID=A0AAV5SLD8_9BILA|nr:hypothetical protein PENTCL1PPCAC_5118 [Pristionchus entomophagus]
MRSLFVTFFILVLLPLSSAHRCYAGATPGIMGCSKTEFCLKIVDEQGLVVKTCDNYQKCQYVGEGCTYPSYGYLQCCCKGDLCNPASAPLVLFPLAAVAAVIAAHI